MIKIPQPADLLQGMAKDLRQRLDRQHIGNPCMIGIQTGGVWVAKQLHKALGLSQPLGKLNITFYRDDFTRIGMHPQVRPSNLPTPVDDRHILLE